MTENTKLDDFDRRILRKLQSDGRISVQDLSEAVGLSPTPVSRRLKHLEEAGIISGYCARLNEVALGFGVTVFVSVRLEKQIDTALEDFENAIADLPEVVDCWLMTGNQDYLLRVVIAGLGEFEKFLVGGLTKVPGVASIESSFPLRQVKAGVTRTI
jgi:Lrp/AsnC family leucine-responsive transcriptional regulator